MMAEKVLALEWDSQVFIIKILQNKAYVVLKMINIINYYSASEILKNFPSES